jgi:hypothetical protein
MFGGLLLSLFGAALAFTGALFIFVAQTANEPGPFVKGPPPTKIEWVFCWGLFTGGLLVFAIGARML